MEVKAQLNYLKIAPRKVRLVADLIRGKRAEEAQTILNFTVKKGAVNLLKLLNSAIANAKNNFKLEAANLYLSKITVDEGPKYKRWRARSRGQAFQIQKKTSHVTIILEEIVKGKTKKTKKKKTTKAEEPEKELVKKEPVEEKKDTETKKTVRPEAKPEKRQEKSRASLAPKRFFRRKAF